MPIWLVDKILCNLATSIEMRVVLSRSKPRREYAHPHPHVQRKVDALLLKSYRLPHGLITNIVGVCPNTARSYFEEFRQGGIDRLCEIRFHKPTSELAPFTDTLENHFRQHPPATIKEAVARIEELTGIKRGLSQVRKFVHKVHEAALGTLLTHKFQSFETRIGALKAA